MIRRLQQHPLGQIFLAWAMLGAILMRVLVPVGYMPAADSTKLLLQICAAGQEYLTLTIAHKGEPAPIKAKGDMPCVFAGAQAVGLLSQYDDVALLPVIYAAQLILGRTLFDITPNRLAAPPPPALAPPVLRF